MSRGLSARAAPTALLLAILAACGSERGFADPDPSLIDGEEVERVIRVLAADDMRGRRAFTDDALRAADFLAGEFAAAGLQPLAGDDDYLQEFTVRSLAVRSLSVRIGDRTLPDTEVVARLGVPSVAWSDGEVPVTVVGPGDGAQQAIVGAVQAGADAFLLVHPDHEPLFRRFSGFFRGPARVLGDAPGGSVVIALAAAGADVAWSVTAAADVEEERLVNVVGMVPGRRADEFVLFSAHYDHIGIRPPVDGDSIANGANDDASGTTAVVALANYFAGRGTPERSLLFAAFTAEEGGGYGSRHFSAQLDPDDIVAMFNIEMIGKPAVEGPNTAWITGFDRSSFGEILQAAVEGTEYAFYADPYPDQNLFYRSDNATLARLGVPAHSISTTPIDVDPDYHQVTDHVETLDLDHMANTIRAIAMGAESIISGEATPTRVDPATVN